MPSAEEQARSEELQAQEWLLYREQCNDLRAQLQAAVAMLGERTGWSRDEVNRQLAARIAAQRQTERNLP